MTTKTRSISLTDELKTALDLVARANSVKVIKDAQEYAAAEADYKALILAEKKLKIKWDELEAVIEYKKLFEQKQALEADFKNSKKYLKDVPMKAYDDRQEAIRLAEERRLQAEAQRLADIETARLVAEQKAAYEKAEAARKAAEAEAKKAQKAAEAAAKKGNEEAAAKARVVATEAAEKAAVERAKSDAAIAERDAIKADAAAAPAPTVVVEKSHASVSRRKVYKYRLTAKDGRKFLKADFTTSTRLKVTDLGALPSHLFVLSPVLLNEYVDSMGEAAALAGVLEVKSEMV